MEAVGVFNGIIAQYQEAIAPMTLLSVGLARETFTKLAVITVAVALINQLLQKQVDAAAATVDLVKTLITLYFFYLLIYSYPQWLPVLGQTFKSVGIHLAGTDADYARNPGLILSQGLNVGMSILKLGFKICGWTNLGLTMISILCALVVMFCFGMIAVQVVIIDIGSRIILGIGCFMLGFGGSPWTRNYAEKYISAMFNLGIQMLFIYVLVGIGRHIADHWVEMITAGGQAKFQENIVTVAYATFVYFMICFVLPGQAATLLTGQISPSYGGGDANIRTVIQGSGAVAAGAIGGLVGGVGGYKAVSAAWQAAGNAAKPGAGAGNIKTLDPAAGLKRVGKTIGILGAAAGERVQDKVRHALDQTSGGRLRAKIRTMQAEQNIIDSAKKTDQQKEP